MSNEIKLNTGDALIVDPCYIKKVFSGYDLDEMRFDALKHIKTLHDGGDGLQGIELPSGVVFVGCDSGRIWLMTAEFPVNVEVESGFSGHIILRKGDADLLSVTQG